MPLNSRLDTPNVWMLWMLPLTTCDQGGGTTASQRFNDSVVRLPRFNDSVVALLDEWDA